MPRIILEDMKLNKTRRQITPKVEGDVPTPTQVKEEIARHIEVVKPIEKDIFTPTVEESKELIKNDYKIKEYFESIKNHSDKPKLSKRSNLQGQSRIFHRPVLVVFILCLILGGIYWGGNIFEKANVDITSKKQLINYKNKQFTASKNESGNNVDFEIMITSSKKTVNTVLTEPKEVSIKAKGSVTLYNEFSTKAEKLSVGTFLVDDAGKTYKIDTTISIPGYKTVDKKVVPGQISVGITSFLPGDAYNGSPSDFNVTAFKGTTKYKKIYGKLKSPLVGGASGIVYTLDSGSQKNIDNIANSLVKEELLNQVKSLVPPGYLLYPGAVNFSYKAGDSLLSKTPESEVEIEGTLAMLLLKEKSLIDNIIKISLPTIKGEELKEIKILDLDKLSFSFVDKNQIITKDMSSVLFSLSGNVNVIWTPDQELLKNKLIGINKDEVLPIFRQDPGISSALVTIFPPWKKHIPNNPLKININIK